MCATDSVAGPLVYMHIHAVMYYFERTTQPLRTGTSDLDVVFVSSWIKDSVRSGY